MPPPVTLADLKRSLERGCDTHGPSCRHPEMTLTARCHPNAPVFAIYVDSIKAIRIRCAACHAHVVDAAVAGELGPEAN